MDEEIFQLDLVEEFAFAASKFIYAEGGPVICYDCDAIIEKLMADGMDYESAIDYMEETAQGSRHVWLHDIDFDVELSPDPHPHLRLVH